MRLRVNRRGPARFAIDRRLVGPPVTIGTRTLQPVARVTGWRVGAADEPGSGAGAMLRLRPIEVLVREADGREYSVSTMSPTPAMLYGMLALALGMAIVGWIIRRALA